MRRRSIFLVWLLSMLVGMAQAQTPNRTYRLGVLASNPIAIETMRTITFPELRKLGFDEERNLIIDARFSYSVSIEGIARHLVEATPDVLVGIGSLPIATLKEATATVPIVMSLGPDDPEAHGFTDSLARPTRNITGLIPLSAGLDTKRLQLLKEMIPRLQRVGIFLAPDVQANLPATRKNAADVGLQFAGIRTAFNRHEYPAALAALRAAGAEALMIGSAPLFSDEPADFVRLATEAGLPSICEWRGLVERGCLLAYGPDLSELRRRTAHYVARILRGAAPSELPIEGPTHFELAINLKTARVLGLQVPPTLLARADEVIE
jgi:putative ABC transport system substrate-binding protein